MRKVIKGNIKYKIASVLLGAAMVLLGSPVAHAQTTGQQDTTAPTVATITPAAGTSLSSGTIKLSAQGVYDPSGVKSVSFAITSQADGTKSLTYAATNTSGSEWDAIVNATDLGTSGTYTVNVVGMDALGNQGVMGNTSFVLTGAKALPVLQSITPQSGTTIGVDAQSFTVQANVSDTSGVKAVSFTAYNEDDGISGSLSLGAVAGQNGSWTQQFNMSSFGNRAGKYKIEVYVMDMTGNVNLAGSTELAVQDPKQVTDTSKADALINAAMAELGKPYVLGGKGPNIFDCSGLVYYALNASGYPISYMTSATWAVSGYQRINSMSDLQRGDIICFKGHVGIYLGNGSMISAVHGGVTISNNIMNNTYWKNSFLNGRRLF
jgi:Cell wall-associated hydrolases (invasion-associated proteins)